MCMCLKFAPIKITIVICCNTVDAQTQLAMAVEKERSAAESVMDLTSKVVTMETQLSCLRQDKTQLTTQTDMLKTKLEVMEDSRNR